MANSSQHLRKAAVFIRSLDGDTAAKLLAQLAPEEASEIHAAVRSLGELDPVEQDDVAAEFRHTAPLMNRVAAHGVELDLSSDASNADVPLGRLQNGVRRFDFLDEAPVEALAQFLAREHVQTIAVVLSYLSPPRAAAVLATLPAALQADTIERLSVLGDTDPDCLGVVERELSDWVAKRTTSRTAGPRRGDTVMSILAAADERSRDQIVVSLKTHRAALAKQLAPLLPASRGNHTEIEQPTKRLNTQAAALGEWGIVKMRPAQRPPALLNSSPLATPQTRPVDREPRAPSLAFDELALLPATELAALLRDVDTNVLVLALAGSSDELVNRICQPMPRRTAKAFRRQLGRLGPTRLSDVESAQRLVAAAAARRIAERKNGATNRTLGGEAPPSSLSVEYLAAR
jgi:flagellar motor switch protein FliG